MTTIVSLALVAVAAVVYFSVRHNQKMNFAIDFSKGKIDFKIRSFWASNSGRQKYIATAYREGNKLGTSYSHNSLRETREDIFTCAEHIRNLGEEGYGADSYFRPFYISRDEKKFHFDPSSGNIWECVYDPDFPRADDDGRCLCCEGWGCCACGHTGGY